MFVIAAGLTRHINRKHQKNKKSWRENSRNGQDNTKEDIKIKKKRLMHKDFENI